MGQTYSHKSQADEQGEIKKVAEEILYIKQNIGERERKKKKKNSWEVKPNKSQRIKDWH